MSGEIPKTNIGQTRMATAEELEELAQIEASVAWSNIARHPFYPPNEQQTDEQN